MQIYIYNKSTLISNNDLNLMVSACNILIKKFCFIWGILPVTITVLNNLQSKLNKVNYLFYIIDNTTIPSTVLAYHTELTNSIVGYVMAKPIIDAGGAILYKDNNTFTVASALFQEIVDTLIDPTVNIWWQLNNLYMVGAELCDPVKNNLVIVEVSDSLHKQPVKVGLSDFIYPSWFDPLAQPKLSSNQKSNMIFNYNNTLTKPFSISSAGSVVLLNTKSNIITYKYGSKVPGWQKLLKHASTRTVIRKHHVEKQLVNLDKPVITEIDDRT